MSSLNSEMYLVSDLTGIWFEIKPIYSKAVKNFLKTSGASKIANWEKYAKLARRGKITYEEALSYWLRECGIKGKDVVRKFISFENKLLKRALIFRGEKILKVLSERIKIIGLTDSPHSANRIRKILKIGKIEKYFHAILTSHDIGMEKPIAFKYVLNKFGNFIFLGHEDDEIEGAKKLGIVTIGLKNRKADFTIETLQELIPLLEKIDLKNSKTTTNEIGN